MSNLGGFSNQKTIPGTHGHMTLSFVATEAVHKQKTTTKHFLSPVSNPGMEHVELKRGGLLTTCKNGVTNSPYVRLSYHAPKCFLLHRSKRRSLSRFFCHSPNKSVLHGEYTSKDCPQSPRTNK